MSVAVAHKGRGRKAAPSVAASVIRRQSALSEGDEAIDVRPMEHDDEINRDDLDGDEEEEEEEEEEHVEEEDDDEEPDSNETSEPEEQVEPPAFSLATLGLQRVGSAPPPKPKIQKAPILTLNARGMPARIRKRNRLFYDENIINDDKPLRMSLAPKKMPGRPPLSAGGGSAQKIPLTPSKVLKKRKGVVSRYMRSSEQGSNSNSASTEPQQLGKHKKTPSKSQSMGSKLGTGGLKTGRGAHFVGKGGAAAAAAAAAAKEEASQAEAAALANKRLGQSIGLRLRNLLKLPKAHKWAIAEWFYSYIDKPLFECRDEFINHVNELAPRLGTRSLNRHEWVNIRRRMGRPRRCSANFFSEERKELDRKRQLMRTLQSRKPGEFKDSMLLSGMPEKIPMPLPLGTKVTARLRTPQDGIFAGTVAAYDSLNAMYRVTFERPGLGTHAIPDYEIVSENFHEMLPLHSFTKDFRPNLMSVYQTNNLGFTTNLGFTANLTNNYLQKKEKGVGGAGAAAGAGAGSYYSRPQKHLVSNNAAARNALSMKLNKSDPLLGQDSVGESPIRQQLARHHAYPSSLLEHLVRLEKYIAVKADRIQRLNKMNASAELAMGDMISQDENGDRHRRQIADNFQRQYAFNIVSIERINGELMFELTKVQEMSSSLTRNPNVQAMISPTYLREECRAKASQTVDDINKGMVKNTRMIKLLKNLTTLLIVTQNLGGDCDVSEVNKVLEGCLEEVRSNLFCSENSEVFQKSVQVRLEYIAMDISRSLEESSLNRVADGNDDIKSLKSEEEMDENHVQDHKHGEDEEPAADTSKTKAKGRPKEAEAKKGHNNQHTDTDTEKEEKLESDGSENAEYVNQQRPDDDQDTEEQHLDREEQSLNPAVTEDTQITIESMKESDEEFQSAAETEEDDMVGLGPLIMEGEEEERFVYEKEL
ncbi:protein lin-9 homolog [Drosophila erecta]|nr:protein lin-9 homolog [Drosophila erecta]